MIKKFYSFINEFYLSSSRAPLYHSTSVHSAYDILISDSLEPSNTWKTISFTRDKNFVYEQYPIIFILDQEKLYQIKKIIPFDYDHKIHSRSSKKMFRQQPEFEETIKGNIQNLHKYIIEIKLNDTIKRLREYPRNSRLCLREIYDDFIRELIEYKKKYNITVTENGSELSIEYLETEASKFPVLENVYNKDSSLKIWTSKAADEDYYLVYFNYYNLSSIPVDFYKYLDNNKIEYNKVGRNSVSMDKNNLDKVKKSLLTLEHINELTNITIRDKDKKSNIFGLWNNGTVIINPTIDDRLNNNAIFGITFKVNVENKTITLNPMDDWSDVKIIIKIQQLLKDLIKSKYINDNWECIISDNKTTKISLGSTKVEKILQYNASFSNVIPFAFHGTSDYFIDEIKSKGLMPRDQSDVYVNWDKGYINESGENVYLSMDYNRALYYAKHTVEGLKKDGIKSKPIVVMIKDLPIANITTDDDIKTNMGMINLLAYIKSGKNIKDFNDKSSYITGIRNSSQFAYKGRIPASMITKIY